MFVDNCLSFVVCPLYCPTGTPVCHLLFVHCIGPREHLRSLPFSMEFDLLKVEFYVQCFVDNCLSFVVCPLYWPTGTPEVTPIFYGVRFAQSWVFCAVFCRWLFVLFRLVIVMFDLLRMTPSDNPHWYLIDFREYHFFQKSINPHIYLTKRP